jgi:hypothetical protein
MKNIEKYESFVNESFGLSYSGGDVESMPIIGRAITKAVGPYNECEYDIVEIIDDNDDKPIYVANTWYKKGVPQLIHSDLVSEYIPIDKNN